MLRMKYIVFEFLTYLNLKTQGDELLKKRCILYCYVKFTQHIKTLKAEIHVNNIKNPCSYVRESTFRLHSENEVISPGKQSPSRKKFINAICGQTQRI